MCCSCILSAATFSGALCGVKASAAVVKKSAADMRSFYGDNLNISYEYEGSIYSTSASFYGVVSSFDLNSIASNAIIPSTSALSTYDIILYQASVPAGNWMYSDVVVEGFYTRFDNYARGGFVGSVDGLGYSGFSVSDSRNSVANWGNNFAGNFSATLSRNSADYYGFVSCSLNPSYGFYVPLRMIQYEFQNGGVIDSVYFDGLRSDNRSHLFVGAICPYVDGNLFNDPAATTAPSGTGDINVSVDMSETNGLLDRILAAIQGFAQSILDGLKGLFIPDDDFMDGFKADMQKLLQDHLGGLYEAEQLMADSFEQLPNVVAKSEIYIPPLTLDLAGTPFKLGDWHVPLKVSGMPAVLYEGIAFIIDFLCLAAFLRMCRNKLEIFLNPDSEVIRE